MREKILALMVAAGLLGAGGCATGGLMQDGEAVRDPPQWTEFCARNPEDPSCPET